MDMNMDIDKEILKNKKKLNTALLILKTKENEMTEVTDYFWYCRAYYMVKALYSFYNILPKNKENVDIVKLINLDTLVSYSFSHCFPELTEYLINLPGFIKNSTNQPSSVYESHGFLTMQITEILSSFYSFYIDEDIEEDYVKTFGVESFINKHKESKTYLFEFLFFKNGIINTKTYQISTISNDFKITTYKSDKNKKTISDCFQESEIKTEENNIKLKEKIEIVFNQILHNINLDNIKKMAQDNFSVLDSTKDINEIKELIELNYNY